MCGIAGIVELNGPMTTEDVVAVQHMLDTQVHRGPDGQGLVVLGSVDSALYSGLPAPGSAPVTPSSMLRARSSLLPAPCSALSAVLGHRRLSIIDLSDAGRQPMSNADGTIWVTYNGEIYNFRELREELRRKGYRFVSQTDTEVLLYGYEEWGIEGLLSRLHGMFAFAVYDTGAKPRKSGQLATGPCLILAKDRFGIKPLYYYHDRNRLLFASEVRPLGRSGLIPDELSLEALVRYLQLGSVPIPLTTVKNLFALPAGHYLTVSTQGVRLKEYWNLARCIYQPDSVPANADRRIALQHVQALLEESVQSHLISDVPLGVFLSGGIDSSALVALTSRLRDQPVKTVSVVFDEPQYNESSYARMVAERYHTDHHEIRLRGSDWLADLPKIFAAMDQPTGDGINTYCVSQAAKQAGLTVVLSGIGGDEVFLGYEHLKTGVRFERQRKLLAHIPQSLRKGVLTASAQAGALIGRMGIEKLLFAPQQIQALLGISAKEMHAYGPMVQSSNGEQSETWSKAAPWYEFTYYLQSQLLKDADCMSMAHSLETRVPFLDHRLVEYVMGLPQAWKIGSQVNKPLLVQALNGSLPPSVWQRPKMGFTFPFAEWMKNQADTFAEDGSGHSLLNKAATKEVWRKFKAGRLHWSRPWALTVLGALCSSRFALSS
jgi:asparagine synthase (glutamine-hydrolysing)